METITKIRGNGTYDDPVREVEQHWEDGELVAEDDPLDVFKDEDGEVCVCSE